MCSSPSCGTISCHLLTVQWRQQQRGGQSRPRLILCEASSGDGAEEVAELAQEAGGASTTNNKGAAQLLAALGMREGVNVRMRTSGILERDREDAWDAVD